MSTHISNAKTADGSDVSSMSHFISSNRDDDRDSERVEQPSPYVLEETKSADRQLMHAQADEIVQRVILSVAICLVPFTSKSVLA